MDDQDILDRLRDALAIATQSSDTTVSTAISKAIEEISRMRAERGRDGKLHHWAAARSPAPDLAVALAASEGRCREMSVEQLAALWDGEWPPGDVRDGVYLEHVYFELNRRGEGARCMI